ncbi:DUF3857 domain-containing protein [Wenyingzhuangia sp. IMCC45574]
MKIRLFFGFFLLCLVGQAQISDYSILSIPDSLKTKADAVIRFCKQEIDIHDERNMTIYFTKVITVLNESGDKYVDAYKFYSTDSKIKKISANVYNKFGIEILKYKKKDFSDESAVSGFYSDNRVKHLQFTPRGYPYTLKFEYVFETQTTAFIPKWYPIDGYYLSVQQNEIIVRNLKGTKAKFKETLFDSFPIKNLSDDTTIHYKIENFPAVKRESYSLNFENILPNLKVYLEEFTLKGYTSKGIKNWKDFGFWLRTNLYNSQLELSDETKQKVLELVKDETDPLKKAKLVYEYMQNRTRYVYVGIGIGGWQPTKAMDVDRLGYGDCKGLSNYTKALLDVAGVESNWVIVYAKTKRNFDNEFHGLQGNHMILNLPKLNHGKDVWLECTSQTIPFGFLSDFTDDREVLVLEKEGGVLKHTPKYEDKNNQQIITGNIVFDSQGNLISDLSIESKGLIYDDMYRKDSYTKTEINKFYKSRRWYYNENLKVNKYHFVNKKDSLSFTEDLNLTVENYASILGDEMIMRVNVFDMYRKSFKKQKNRRTPLLIRKGSVHKDYVDIKVPEGYSLTKLPQKKAIDSKFGRYWAEVKKKDETTLRYEREFYIKEGEYSKEDFNGFSSFLSKVRKYDNQKIVFNKNKS